MQIPYKYYDFNWSPTISEIDYKHLKRTLELDPNVKFFDEPSFYAKFKWGILTAIISTSFTVFVNIIWRMQRDTAMGGKLNKILVLSEVASFFSVVGLFGLAGGASFLWYVFERNLYYRRMKRELIRSASYSDFLADFYRRYYSSRYPFA